MPKIVDHEERRRCIAEAVLQLVAERGFESVTVRAVAAGAGVSAGMVQHYFRTKEEMTAFAMGVVGERVRARLAASTGGGDAVTGPIDLVRALLHELVPRDRGTRAEARVTLAFLAQVAANPSAARGMREDLAMFLAVLAERVTEAQAAGEVRADVAPAEVSRSLLALVDGLGLHVVSGQYTADEAIAAFDACAGLLRASEGPTASRRRGRS